MEKKKKGGGRKNKILWCWGTYMLRERTLRISFMFWQMNRAVPLPHGHPSWRNGLIGNLCSLTHTNAKSWAWDKTSLKWHWKLTGWICRKGLSGVADKLQKSEVHSCANQSPMHNACVSTLLASRSREGIIPFHLAFVRPYLDYWIQSGIFRYWKDTGKWKQFQWMDTEVVRGWGTQCTRRARRAALVSSCKEKAKREILEVFTDFTVRYRKDKTRLFLELDTNGTRDNGHFAKMQTLVVPYEDGQTEAQRHCEISVFGGIQNSVTWPNFKNGLLWTGDCTRWRPEDLS